MRECVRTLARACVCAVAKKTRPAIYSRGCVISEWFVTGRSIMEVSRVAIAFITKGLHIVGDVSRFFTYSL